MGDNKNYVKEITNIDEDFAKWYTDIVRKAELADYTDTKGCIAIRPYGYAIWENIQNYADKKFKEVGIDLTANDFNYSIYVNEYMQEFFKHILVYMLNYLSI